MGSVPTPRPGILGIKPYIGGDSTAASAPLGRISRLASNESPFGAGPRAVAAFKQCAGSLHRYPDGAAGGLRAALAEYHGIDGAGIVCGNGSGALLALLAKCYAGAGDEVLISAFGFLLYPIVARSAGATPVVAPEPHHRVDVDALVSLAGAATRIVFLDNPNNPTGSYLPAPRLRELHRRLPAETLLVIDAAYAEYVTADDYDDGLRMVEEFDNVVVTRTFSKLHGLAALRVGWAYCPAAVADVLNRVRGPFNVTAPSQAAACAALADEVYIKASRDHNTRWLPWLGAALAGLGLTVHPSVANFVLVEFPGTLSAAAVRDHLLRRGIITREMDSYGLPDCLRISIGLEEDMRAVVSAVAEFTERGKA